MSVFDENRDKCTFCGDYVNHWEQSSNDLHNSGLCMEAERKKEQKLAEHFAKINRLTMALRLAEKGKLVKDYDYLLDLEYTLADI